MADDDAERVARLNAAVEGLVPEPAPEPPALDPQDSRNPASGYVHPEPVTRRRRLGDTTEDESNG